MQEQSKPLLMQLNAYQSLVYSPPPKKDTIASITKHSCALNKRLNSIRISLTRILSDQLIPQKLSLLFIALFALVVSISFAKTNVRYAGFCFNGSYVDIPTNYKYTNLIVQQKNDNQTILDKEFSRFFQSNSEFNNFSLVFGQASDADKIALAIALNREDVAFENINGKTKAIYNLGCTIFILDFAEMKVIQSYPLKASFIDLYNQKPSDNTIKDTFTRLYLEKITQQITSNKSNIALRSANARSMKVANVTFSADALPYLSFYKDNLKAYSSLIAQHVTECFAYQMNVTMLPYSKDYLGQKMSLAFTDASVQNFSIPASSYDIDVDVTKFVKKLYKESAAEKVDIYGSYVNVRIYDAELGTEYWKNEIKYGATKQTSANQIIEDDFFNYNEVLLATFSKQVITTLQEDKKLMKGVIAKCANY